MLYIDFLMGYFLLLAKLLCNLIEPQAWNSRAKVPKTHKYDDIYEGTGRPYGEHTVLLSGIL